MKTPHRSAASAGTLRAIGAYLEHGRKASTVTVLQDGTVLLFGDDLVYGNEGGRPMRSLHERFGAGTETYRFPHAEPLAWRGDRPGWQRLPRPPGCKGNLFMPSATPLGDGRVLLAGGLCDLPRMLNDTTPRAPHVATSIWNVTRGEWEAGPDLGQSRLRHTATQLTDGSVLLVGGITDPALAADPVADARGSGGADASRRSDPNPVVEPVLASVERLQGDRVQVLPPLSVARAGHTATLLADGSVLVVGGRDASGMALDSVERWNPSTGQWQRMPAMAVARHGHSATRLADGRVLVTGGHSADARFDVRVYASTEIFDPASGLWSESARLPRALRHHATTLLGDGSVLLVGGRLGSPSPYHEPWVWLLDARQQQWLPAGSAIVATDVEWEVTPDLQRLPDDRVRIFTGTRVLLWTRRPSGPETLPPAWFHPPAAKRLGTGRVLVVGSTVPPDGRPESHAYEWDPAQRRWRESGRPAQRRSRHHAVAQLPSGRVMHVGVGPGSAGGDSLLAQCRQLPEAIWRPCGELALSRWTDASLTTGLLPDGRLVVVTGNDHAAVYDEDREAFIAGSLRWQLEGLSYGAPVLPSRPMVELSLPNSDAPLDVSAVAAQYWESLFKGWRSASGVKPSGSIDVDWASDAGPRMLWDASRKRWTYILQHQSMGRRAVLLSDGCALSPDPLTLFDPNTSTARGLPDPGMGLEPGSAQVLRLSGDEIVVVGVPVGGVGTGLYQTRATCAGLAPDPDAALVLHPWRDDDPRYRIAAAAQSPVATQAQAQDSAQSPGGWERLSAWWPRQPLWVAAALLLPLLAYLLIRRVVIPRVRVAARKTLPEKTTGLLGRRLPTWVAVLVRVVIYVPVGLLVAVWGAQILLVSRFEQARDESDLCRTDPRACVDRRTGLIASVPELEATGPTRTPPQIPCRFVGVWSTVQGGMMFRITLMDDGRFRKDRNVTEPSGYGHSEGFWMVQSGHFVWRYPRAPQEPPVVNRLASETATSFALLEQDGQVSKFELLDRRQSSRCVP
ncbi:MAG: kelch repeat-containing protein [bacterium]|jgi:hypothetical protein|nr:hypothetical protein [Betaproteobacteria bacterium]